MDENISTTKGRKGWKKAENCRNHQLRNQGQFGIDTSPECFPVAGFEEVWIRIVLRLQETLQSQPGSKGLTTRRFKRKWQHKTPGVTQLLNGARSSVSSCRNSVLARGDYLG
jgi:hypothetical protein